MKKIIWCILLPVALMLIPNTSYAASTGQCEYGDSSCSSGSSGLGSNITMAPDCYSNNTCRDCYAGSASIWTRGRQYRKNNLTDVWSPCIATADSGAYTEAPAFPFNHGSCSAHGVSVFKQKYDYSTALINFLVQQTFGGQIPTHRYYTCDAEICTQGYMLNESSFCEQCSNTTGVASFWENTCSISSCIAGFSKSGNYLCVPNCSAGDYDDSGTCRPCPAGYYCPAGLSTTPANYGSTYGCLTGHYCPQRTKSATEYPCPIGTYNPLYNTTNISACVSCGAGRTTATTGCATSGLCSFCSNNANANTWSSGNCIIESCNNAFWLNSNSCKTCPTNATCNGTSTFSCNSGFAINGDKCSPIICPGGQWLNGSNCETCPIGYKCPFDNTKTLCNATDKEYQDQTNQSTCKTCPTGQIANQTRSGCVAITCPAGQWLDSDTCTECSTGWRCSNNQKTFCGNNNEYQDQFGQSICKTCAIGTEPNLNRTGCQNIQCPAGQWLNGSTCTQCSIGNRCEYNLTIPCSSDIKEYQDEPNQSTCKTCPTGQQSNATHTGCESIICPTNQILNGDNCICPAGNYMTSGNCIQCTLGSYCPLNSTTETPCPYGSYCPTPTEIYTCPTNHACAAKSTELTCAENYTLTAGYCLADTRSCTDKISGSLSALETWNGTTWINCTLESCLGTHIADIPSNTCIAQEQDCASDIPNATSAHSTWNGTTWTNCTLESCRENYTVNISTNTCDPITTDCTNEIPNALSAYATWNGTSFANCTPTMCSDGYKIEGKLCKSKCASNEHWENNGCVNNTRDCKSKIQHAKTAYERWDTLNFEWGTCSAETCNDGFHPELDGDGNICESNTRECTSSIPNASIAYQTWSESSNWNVECIPYGCEYGFKKVAAACAICEESNAEVFGENCAIVSCKNGYENKNNKCEPCGKPNAREYGSGCVIVDCNENYELKNGRCIAIIKPSSVYDQIESGLINPGNTSRVINTVLTPGMKKSTKK